MNRRRLLSLAVLTSVGLPAFGQGQSPMRMVVPFTAGGSPDLIARFLAERLGATFNEAVVVENIVGASGGIGTAQVARAAPDGRTVVLASTGPLTVNPVVSSVSYDPVRDLEPVILLGRSALVLMVNKDLPVQTLQDLLALARSSPGKLSYASAGSGNLTNLVGELLKLRTGVDILHVPYKGTAALKPDVLAGRISMFFDTAPAALPLVQSGQVKALAVTTKNRAAVLPQVPSIAELGVDPEFDVSGWFALLAPKNTPQTLIQPLNRQVQQILQSPEVTAKFGEWGIEAIGGPPGNLRELIDKELARWREVVRTAHIASH